MSRIRGLDHVALIAQAPETVSEFYQALWGMRITGRSAEAHYLGCPPGDGFDLVVLGGEANALGHVSFSVRRDEDLDAIASEALRRNYPIARAPGPAPEPGQRRSMAVRDPDGNLVELTWPGGPSRSDGLEGSPRKLGHVVLWTPDPAAMEGFYGWLGFKLSDQTARGMSFLRCNTDHHTLAFVKGNRSGLQHLAFDGRTIDSVMRTLGRLQGAGVRCIWGPGKHGPGANIFTYYKDPAGTVIELYAELEQVPDTDDPIEVRFWGTEHKGDVWGTAGPLPQEFIG